MIAIIDYGVGNLFSLKSSLNFIGVDTIVTSDESEIKKADKIILPGVGAFEDAIGKLTAQGLDKIICDEVENGKEILGICLGMQLLFEKSYEYGKYNGLGLIKGCVKLIETDPTLKIPHIGWNGLIFPKNKEKSKLYRYIEENDCVYFVHSYAGYDCDESVSARTEYGEIITASVENANVYGTQFHPEKSGNVGLNILKAFCE